MKYLIIYTNLGQKAGRRFAIMHDGIPYPCWSHTFLAVCILFSNIQLPHLSAISLHEASRRLVPPNRNLTRTPYLTFHIR